MIIKGFIFWVILVCCFKIGFSQSRISSSEFQRFLCRDKMIQELDVSKESDTLVVFDLYNHIEVGVLTDCMGRVLLIKHDTAFTNTYKRYTPGFAQKKEKNIIIAFVQKFKGGRSIVLLYPYSGVAVGSRVVGCFGKKKIKENYSTLVL